MTSTSKTGTPSTYFPAAELLRCARIFIKLDLRSAYQQVRISEGDERILAFNTRSGHYEYLVKPFGPTSAPVVFKALREILNDFVIIYLDNNLISHLILRPTSSTPTESFRGCCNTDFTSNQKNVRLQCLSWEHHITR